MSKVTYLANPSSPHVRQWLELQIFSDPVIILHIGSISTINAINKDATIIAAIPPYLRWLPKLFKYALLGVVVRLHPSKYTALHAHNSSGYGLSALISGRPYILTTYGTEVFGAKEKGSFYLAVLRKILKRSKVITATATEMERAVIDIEPSVKNKVTTFSLGVSAIFMRATPVKHALSETGTVWIVNRRIHPHYQTLDVVNAFLDFEEEGGAGRLVLIQGDFDHDYLCQVKARVLRSKRIDVVDRFLSPSEMVEYLDASDFCLSVPISDQLSSSILEGMARRCVPILAPLPSYKDLKSNALLLNEKGSIREQVYEAFKRSSQIPPLELESLKDKAREFVQESFSASSARQKYSAALNRLHNP